MVGGAPIEPAATCTFCACSAVTTSPAVKPLSASRLGSTHRRIAYLRSPNTRTSDTPLMRLRSLTTLFSRKLVRYAWSQRLSVDVMPSAATNVPEFFETVTPICLTSFGSRPCARFTAFCTSFAAWSRLRSRLNVAVICEVPSLPDDDCM